jgi:hypothetical protein
MATSRAQADQIINNLRDEGFSHNDVSALFPDKEGARDFAYQKRTKFHKGAVVATGGGVILHGTLGWLTGATALDIPGVGQLIVAGPIFTPLIDVALGVARDGIGGVLIDMGLPDHEARRVEEKLASGNIFISIHSRDPEEVNLAREIFEAAGARDIATPGKPDAKNPPDFAWTPSYEVTLAD